MRGIAKPTGGCKRFAQLQQLFTIADLNQYWNTLVSALAGLLSMPQGLFREEALQSFESSQFGELQHDAGSTFLAIATTLFLCLVVAAWQIGSSTYSRKQYVTGQIDESNANAITSPDWGYVAELSVTEGQHVEAGAHIITTAKPLHGRSIAIAEETRQQMAHRESMNRALEEAYTTDDKALLIRERQLSVLETLVKKSIALQLNKVEQLEQHLSNTASLHEAGYLSNLDWLTFKTSLIAERQQLNGLRQKFIDHQRSRTELRQNRSALRTKKESQSAELGSILSALRERLIELETEPFQRLVALRAGIVTRIEISSGASIRPGQVLVYIDSPQSAVTATLNIPSDAAGHLKSGQRLALELDAFPAGTYGRITAVVTQLSPHTIMQPDRSGSFPARLNIEPGNRIEPILPGMTFRTTIPIEQRTLFSWFLKPLEKLGETLG